MITFDTKRHGGVPFWFWNGEQEESEITRQLELAAAAGLRGMAVHARVGNQIEYMTERWIALVRHTSIEAARLGLEIWLYDEEGFPSGTVGHRLPKRGVEFQQKSLSYSYMTGADVRRCERVVAVFPGDDLAHGVEPGAVQDEREYLAFRIEHMAGYVDTIRREVIDTFMDMTHRPYYEALKECFGSPITAVYTDDLNSFLSNAPALPYTEGIFEAFRDRHGYSLADALPGLVENVPGCERTRFDFRSFVLSLFLDNCVRPMHEWCRDHGVMLTGHLSGDEGPIWLSAHRFGAQMPFHEHEDVPGVDDYLCGVVGGRYLAGLRNHVGFCSIPIFKMASSVANQLKDGIAGSEVLTYMGWGVSLAEQAAFLMFEHALGITLITHHDFSYATGGVAKRDCPASYFFQQPYWFLSKKLTDQAARCAQLLARGTYDASVLVVYPSASAWVALDGRGIARDFQPRNVGTHPDPNDLEDELAEVSRILLGRAVGFEYGDETLLASHGSVEDARLRVGKMSYGTVIVPPVTCLHASTVSLLEQFVSAGGRVIAIAPASCLVDGREPERPVWDETLGRATRVAAPGDLAALEFETTFDAVDAAVPDQVVCHTRLVEGRREHFLVNVSGEDAPIAGTFGEPRVVYDPYADRVVHVGRELPDGFVIPHGHAVHVLPADVVASDALIGLERTVFARATETRSEIDAAAWKISRREPNALLLDWRRYVDGEESYYFEERSGEGRPAVIEVDIPEPARVRSLMCERSVIGALSVNETALADRGVSAHPASQDFAVVGLDGLLHAGRNEIGIRDGDVAEPVYLLGDFDVTLRSTDRGARPELATTTPALGNLAERGMPFYWGAVSYTCRTSIPDGCRTLDCGAVDGAVACVVNGRECGSRLMAPYRFDIAGAVCPGENEIELVLYNTAQNLFGPHRTSQGGRGYFEEHASWVRGAKDYVLSPFGIHGPVCLR